MSVYKFCSLLDGHVFSIFFSPPAKGQTINSVLLQRFRVFFFFCLSGFLFSCLGTVEYSGNFPAETKWTVSHRKALSYQLDQESEQLGTIFDTRFSVTLKKSGDRRHYQRELIGMEAKGWHKGTLASELEKKARLEARLSTNGELENIDGYDSLSSIFKKVEQKSEQYRKELLQNMDTSFFKARLADDWRLLRFLKPGVYKMDQSLNVSELNAHLQTLKIDSAKILTITHSGDKKCLQYQFFYERSDSLNYMIEYVLSHPEENVKYRHYEQNLGLIQGNWRFAVTPTEGLPCYDERSESAHLTLTHPKTKREMKVNLLLYEENSYVY